MTGVQTCALPISVVGFESALLLHQLSDILPEKTHLIVPSSFRKKPPANVVLHKAKLLLNEISTQQGVQVTTPLRTLLDLAKTPISPEHFNQAVQEALQKGMVRQQKLVEAAQTLPSKAQQRLVKAIKTL